MVVDGDLKLDICDFAVATNFVGQMQAKSIEMGSFASLAIR